MVWTRRHQGDAHDLSFLEERSVDLVVTSPPYWQRRDYGHPDQLGQERTPEAYVEAKIGKYNEIADPELLGYVELAVDELLKEHPLDLLHRARYQIRNQIRARIDEHYLRWTKERYEEIRNGADAEAGEKRLVADEAVSYEVPTEDELPASQCGTSYRKSVFEYPGKLNKEESELATDLDGLENVRCWYRNPDEGGFFLQGYRKAKFNPDFVAFTESGVVAALEYKGEDRLSNEDTQYKQALGEDWAGLDPGCRYFRVAVKTDVQKVLKELAQL